MVRPINLLKRNWYLFAIFFTSYIYFRVAPLRVDAHHDGIILGTAIGVADGHPILSGVFSQYGPLPGLIQGFILDLFNTQLLTLRYFTGVQCLLIGLILYKLSSEFVSIQLAKAISLFWLLASCVWSTPFQGSLLPWPSLISTLLVLLGLFNLIKSVRLSEPKIAILAGFFLGLAGFSRIQAFIILPAILIIGRIKFKESRKILKYSALGFTGTISLVLAYLISLDSLDDYWKQAIVTPLFHYSGVGSSHNYNRFYVVLYSAQAILFLILMFLAKFGESRIKSRYLRIICLTSVISLTGYVGAKILKIDMPIRVKVLIGEPLANLVISPLFFGCVVSIFLGIFIFRKQNNQLSPAKFKDAIIIFASIATIPQLYPQADVMHLWWISPVFLIAILVLIERFPEDLKRTTSAALQTILIASIILGTISAFAFINRPKAAFNLDVLRGTYSDARTVQSLDLFKIIEVAALEGKTSFDCEDGVFSVIGGEYLAADEWFVNWGFGPNELRSPGKVRIICNQSRTYSSTESNKLGMELIYYQENKYGKSVSILENKEEF